jgi:hypothetical protein
LTPLRHDATETTFISFTYILSHSVFVEFFLSGCASKSEGSVAFTHGKLIANGNSEFDSRTSASGSAHGCEC